MIAVCTVYGIWGICRIYGMIWVDGIYREWGICRVYGVYRIYYLKNGTRSQFSKSRTP